MRSGKLCVRLCEWSQRNLCGVKDWIWELWRYSCKLCVVVRGWRGGGFSESVRGTGERYYEDTTGLIPLTQIVTQSFIAHTLGRSVRWVNLYGVAWWYCGEWMFVWEWESCVWSHWLPNVIVWTEWEKQVIPFTFYSYQLDCLRAKCVKRQQ